MDFTALYDAVATMDTVTLVRSAIRGMLRVCDHELEGELRGLLGRDDDYRSAVDTEPMAAAGQPVAVDEAASDQPAAAVDEHDDANGPAAAGHADNDERLAVYGDCAYGAGALLETLEHADADVICKVQPPVAPDGRYAKDRFDIDLQAGTATCPAGHVAPLRKQADGQIARFGAPCAGCPLAERDTTSPKGRTIHVGPHEAQLTRARQRQSDPAWKADYTTTPPKVERKIAHLMRRKHGGRRARVRGQTKTAAVEALGLAPVREDRAVARPAGRAGVGPAVGAMSRRRAPCASSTTHSSPTLRQRQIVLGSA